MIEAYKKMFANYANFSGRASKGEYWWVVLCQVIIYVVFYVLMFAGAMISNGLVMVVYGLMMLYGLATFVPLLALTMRRLHDSDKSGWFVLLGCIPCVNIVLLVFMIIDGTPGSNKYGEPSSLSQFNTK